MKTYRAEILGQVPQGLSADDVYGSVVSAVNEKTILESHSMRRLSDGMVSVIVTYLGLNDNEAKETARYASAGVFNFSSTVNVSQTGSKQGRR